MTATCARPSSRRGVQQKSCAINLVTSSTINRASWQRFRLLENGSLHCCSGTWPLKTDLHCMQACIGKVKKLAKLSTDSKVEIEAFEARLAEAAAERRAEEDAAEAAEVHAAAAAGRPAGAQAAASGSPTGAGDTRMDTGCDGQAEGRD